MAKVHKDSDETQVFLPLVKHLKQTTRMPLVLPTLLPYDKDATNPLYANIQSSTVGSYFVEIGWVPGCEGGNACHYGTVRGSRKPFEDDGKRLPIKLAHQIDGYFVDFACGAHCDDAVIGWSEYGYYYEISLKAGKLGELKEMANSAIGAANTSSR